MRYHYSPTSIAKTKIIKTENTSGTTGTISPASENIKLWKSFWHYLVKFKTSIPSGPVFLFLHIIPTEMCVHEHQKKHTKMFIFTSIIYNRAKLETTQIPIKSRI